MKQNKLLLFALAFASTLSAKMPDQIKAPRNFTSTGTEITSPIYRIGELSNEELAILQAKHPDIDIENFRFYMIDKLGKIEPFQFKVNKTLVETRTDYVDLNCKIAANAIAESLDAVYSSTHRTYRYYSHENSNYKIISPRFYYSNDFEDLRSQEIKNICSEQIGATIASLLGGFLAGTIGVITAQSIKNREWIPEVSREDGIYVTIPATVAFSTMVYQMYSQQAARYLEITKEEYLQIRKLYPGIDCDSFSVTHPIKKIFWKVSKYFGVATAIAGTIAACKACIKTSH